MTVTKRLIVFIYIVLLILPESHFGQRYNFKIYSLEEGLPQSQVYAIFQDSRGYLWCGTYGSGVSRFDGSGFLTFTKKEGLSDNVVLAIHEDGEGHLWFGTENGVNQYDGKNFKVFTTKDGLAHNVVRFIYEDNQGLLWFATEGGGVSQFDGQTFTNYTEKEGLVDNVVRSIYQSRNGDLWIGTLKGASRFNGQTFINYTVERGLIDNEIYSIVEDLDNRLWFGTSKGVSRYDGKEFLNFSKKDGLADDMVRFVFEDRQGNMWFATRKGGISKYDGVEFTNYSTKEGLSYDRVHAMLQDYEGNMWFATDRGICQFRAESFALFSRETGLKNEMVWSFWQDPGGVMWIATEGGIARYYGKGRPMVMAKQGIESQIAYPFFEDSKGSLWFGALDSIFRYDGARYTDLGENNNIIEEFEVYSIFEDSQGNMWFGSGKRGLARYNGRGFRYFTTADGLLNNTVNTIGEDAWGHLYFGTDGGLSIFNGKTFKNITPEQGLPSKSVMAILKDAENDLWIGTYGGGVIKYRPLKNGEIEELATFTTQDGLGGDEVLLMIFDDFGDLIVGTHSGISKLDVVIYNRTGEKRIKHYDKYNGFIGIECNQNAAYKDRQGHLWFGTIKGAIRYDQKEEIPNPLEPITHIKSVKLFLEEVDWSYYSDIIDRRSALPIDLALPHHQNHLTFEFVGISLTVPENVKYRFILEGFDREWSPITKKTFATYSNLPPGDYIFRVTACNGDGIWNVEPETFRFTIMYPFWQKWWFYLALIFFGLAFISMFIKFRIGNLDKQQGVLKEKIDQHIRELEQEKAMYEKNNRELERRVKERTERLESVNKQLVQAHRMEAIGTLAEGVSHDLNNILAGIINYPELLLEKISQEDPLHEFLEKIKRSGEKAAAIVEDLQILSGSIDSRIDDVVDLNPIISEYLKSPECEKLKFYHPQVQLEVQLEEDLDNILGSGSHLYNAAKNMISNAAEAIPEGGRIVIKTENRIIDRPTKGIETIKEGEYVVFAVEDSGKELSAIEKERIFEPFYTKKVLGRSGTGLGMAVVWGTVKDHKGFVDVQSKKGKGTIVSIYFPKTTLKVFKDKLVPQIADLKGRGESILVVDDVKEQREIASLILLKLGYEVTAVSSGEEAIEYLKENEIHLVLLDMIMDPGMDGCETYKHILKFKPKQKVIIASGFSESERVNQAKRLGAGAFIKKPYLLKEIALAIKTGLRK
jgi:ligand-binding sensor domain-containing protein/signal transduction histidine kinase/CheY-like chemotaxis protein